MNPTQNATARPADPRPANPAPQTDKRRFTIKIQGGVPG
jgi:hypothetical protein